MRTLPDVMRAAYAARRPLVIVGQPGIGKTDAVAAFAADCGVEYHVDVATTADPMDIRGLPAVVNGAAEYLPLGLSAKISHGRAAGTSVIVFIDDLGHADHAVQKAYMHIIMSSSGDKNVWVVCATNDVGQRAGVTNIISPLLNRALVYHAEPDVPAWCDWATSAGLPPVAVAFAKRNPTLFESWVPPVGINPSLTPRSLHMLADVWQAGGKSLIHVSACVGDAAAAQFIAHSREFAEWGALDEILKNPLTATVPKQHAKLWCILCALASHIAANPADIKTALVYLGRVGLEHSVAALSDVTNRNPKLKTHPDIRAWLANNARELLA